MNSTWTRLFQYIKTQKTKILFGVLATLLMGIVELFTGAMLKFLTDLVDKFSGSFLSGVSHDIKLPLKFQIKLPLLNSKIKLLDKKLEGSEQVIDAMVVLLFVFLLSYLLLSLFNYARRVFMNDATQAILKQFKSDIYKKTLNLPMAFFAQNQTGDIVSRITYDVTTLNEIIDLFIEVARALVYLLLFIPVMFFMSWQLALFTILFFPLSIILIHKITVHIKKVSKKLTDNVGDYTSFLEEKINRIGLIKSFNNEQKEAAEFDHLVNDNYKHNIRLIHLKYALNPSTDFLGMLILAVVYLFYTFRLSKGDTSLGDIVFFLYIVKTTFKPIKKVAQAWGQMHVALISTKKIFNLLDEPVEEVAGIERQSIETINSVTFNKVAFKYASQDKMIFEGLSFTAQKGDIVALKGKTGVGKSSLLKLMVGFNNPVSGQVLFNHIDSMLISLKDIRKRVVYVASAPWILNASILENIEYGNAKVEASFYDTIVSFISLNSLKELQQVIGEGGMDLSDGQKQKICLLRGILSQPDVLILDEVFTSIDELDLPILFDFCAKIPITFIVSRNTKVLSYATRTMEFNDGQLRDIDL